MKTLFGSFCIAIMSLALFNYAPIKASETHHVQPVALELKPRMPEWRPKIIERFPDGNPSLVLFFEDGEDGESVPVKRISFYENGKTKEETDLISVNKESEGFKLWDSEVVPHGVSVEFLKEGQLDKIYYYNQGLLHGTQGNFYPDGKPKDTISYKMGQKHGSAVSFYQDGTKSLEAEYIDDKIEGDVLTFYQNGTKKSLTPFVKGVIHGKVMHWYEDGTLKETQLFAKGKLQSDANSPAVLTYNTKNVIVEAKDFENGEPVGTHVKYYDNGMEAHKISFRKGKPHGEEILFDEEGDVCGGGKYFEGKKIGRHYKLYPSKALAYEALYDEKGNLLEPVDRKSVV